MLTYLALVEHLRPKWVVWENVPGVLSSGRGRDFGTFLGALGKLGYGFAYRVLDAQWVRTHRHPYAVPQRRRRVFVVGCFGNTASAAAVLFESESVQRHSSSRGKAGKNIAGTIAARFGISRNNIEECVTVHTPFDLQSFGDYGNGDVASTCKSRDHKDSTDVVVIDRAAFNQGANASYDPHIAITDVMDPLVARGPHAVAFTKAKRAQSANDDESWVEGVVAPTQNAFDIGDTRATTAVVSQPMGVDLFNGTMTGDIHVPLRTAGGHGAPAVAIPIHDQATRWAGKNGNKSDGKGNGFGVGSDGDPSPTLTQGDKHAVAHAFYSTGGSHGLETNAELSPPLKVGSSIGIPSPVAVAITNYQFVREAMTVRRLTPRECERLQGFPDDWTLVPWRRGMATDGNRYKAIGNSMAVNCMEWIGERIAAVEAR